MGFKKEIILLFFFVELAVVHGFYWKKYETQGRICDPAPIGVPAYSEKGCQDACSKRPGIKFCEFNIVTKAWCMMGYVCTRLITHPVHKYIVWVKVDDVPHAGGCIKIVNGASCSCLPGNCKKPDIKKWLGTKCGVAISNKQEVGPGHGPSFSQKMMNSAYGLSWQYNWWTNQCPWKYPSNVRFVPQFWGAHVYDFPQLKLDGNFVPTKDNEILPILLGFNEPDLPGGGGSSSMTVDQAVNYWKLNVINGIKRGYRTFVSPAIILPLPRKYSKRVTGNYWLPNFLDKLASEPRYKENLDIGGKTFSVEIDWKSTVDYVAMHKYEPNCLISEWTCKVWDMDVTVGAGKLLMEDYNRNKGFNIKGIWLTEFAGWCTDKCKTLTQQKGLLEKWVPMLLKEESVTAFAWFSYDNNHSPYYSVSANLWDYRTEQPSLLGKRYFDLCAKHGRY